MSVPAAGPVVAPTQAQVQAQLQSRFQVPIVRVRRVALEAHAEDAASMAEVRILLAALPREPGVMAGFRPARRAVAKLADAVDLKSASSREESRFDSGRPYFKNGLR